MILPKLEITYFDEVNVAALISVRQKNHKPIVFADKAGNVFALNKKG